MSRRFILFITILLFVCTLIFLNNRLSSGSLRRVAYWIFNGVNGSSTEASILFDENSANRFALSNGNLAVISPQELSVYRLSGKKSLSTPVLLRTPTVSSNGSSFIAYDLGGVNYTVANSRKVLCSGAAEAKITNANISKSGAFTIITDGPECKSLVTVFNPSGEAVYKFHSVEKYVFDATVSPNEKTIAMLCYSVNEGKFESTLNLCKKTDSGFYATASLGDSMPLKLSFNGDGRILIACSDKTLVYNTDGELVSDISFDELPLLAFSVSQNNHSAYLLDNYKNGGTSRLVVVNKNGENSGSLDFSEEIYSLSSSGNFISVQFVDKCVVYRDNLELFKEYIIPTSVTKCFVNSDGSVLAIDKNCATLCVS